MYVYGSIVEPSGFRVLGFVVALGVPFNKQQLLSKKPVSPTVARIQLSPCIPSLPNSLSSLLVLFQ